MDNAPITTGYYRYSDIQFEWHKAITDPTERSALKAFVSHTSLGDEKNPLWSSKEKGLPLYIGTLVSGKIRLMYSSKQVEYVRYWLHHMGYTRALLPIPSSDYLLTDSFIEKMAVCYYKTPEEIKKALRHVDKMNSRLKGADAKLIAYREDFEKVRQYWAAQEGTWLSIDFEAWEYEHDRLTECGYSMYRSHKGEKLEKAGHFIVKENMNYRNGKYVTDQRDHYKFGESEVVSKAMLKKWIHDTIRESAELGPLFLVFHDYSQDLKYLTKPPIDVPEKDISFIHYLQATPTGGVFLVDTSELFGALEGETKEKRSLSAMCRLLKLTCEHAHNAGNDAHYTLECLKSMASGNQIDSQREERWPNQLEGQPERPTTMKVLQNPWEEDSDYSDLEGAFGRPVDSSKLQEGLELSDDEEF